MSLHVCMHVDKSRVNKIYDGNALRTKFLVEMLKYKTTKLKTTFLKIYKNFLGM